MTIHNSVKSSLIGHQINAHLILQSSDTVNWDHQDLIGIKAVSK